MRQILILLVGCGLLATSVLIQSFELNASDEATSAKAPSALPKGAGTRSKALSVDESLTRFELSDDLVIECVASEPAVVDPVAMAFDAAGDLYVVEMRDYPLGPQKGDAPRSRIVKLIDADHDGHYESSTPFAEQVLFPTGLMPWRDGFIVTSSGEVSYLKDTDADGKADVHEVWYRGFAEQNSQLRANHPTLGPDFRVYIANGLRGGTVQPAGEGIAKGSQIDAVKLTRRDFAFDPNTGAAEAVNGNGQFGLAFDVMGNRFVCDNRHPCRHVVLEQRDRHPDSKFLPDAVMQDVLPASENSRLFPKVDAWTTSNLHANQFTAACGLTIDNGSAFPSAQSRVPNAHADVYCCEPTASLVHMETIVPHGLTFRSTTKPEPPEFLASSDPWFRPVNLTWGPDGCLYICDMHRAVIEHPQWVPEELKNRPDTDWGNDAGRIWRVRPKRMPNVPEVNSLAEAKPDLLVHRLEHSYAWVRETARRLLFERADNGVLPALDRLVDGEGTLAAKASAIQLRHAIEPYRLDQLMRMLDYSGPSPLDPVLLNLEGGAITKFSRHAVDIRTRVMGKFPKADQRIVNLVGHSLRHGLGPMHRLFALNAIRDSESGFPWLERKLLMTSPAESLRLLKHVRPSWRHLEGGTPFQLEFIERLAAIPSDKKAFRSEALSWSIGLDRRPQQLMLWAFMRGAARHSPEVIPEMNSTWVLKSLNTAAMDDEADQLWRTEAIRTLALFKYHDIFRTLLPLAIKDPDLDIRLAALDVLARYSDSSIPPLMIKGLSGLGPAEQRKRIAVLMAHAESITQLLHAIESDALPATILDLNTQKTLTAHRDAAIRKQAKAVFDARIATDRLAVIERYQPALAGQGDATRGRELFTKQCSTCHKIGDVGTNVGPDISDSRTKTPLALLTDILHPNRAIDANYVAYTVLTTEGLTETGLLTAETADAIQLKLPGGKSKSIARRDIEEMRNNGKSLMPVGFEKNLTPDQMRDLLAWIKGWRYEEEMTERKAEFGKPNGE